MTSCLLQPVSPCSGPEHPLIVLEDRLRERFPFGGYTNTIGEFVPAGRGKAGVFCVSRKGFTLDALLERATVGQVCERHRLMRRTPGCDCSAVGISDRYKHGIDCPFGSPYPDVPVRLPVRSLPGKECETCEPIFGGDEYGTIIVGRRPTDCSARCISGYVPDLLGFFEQLGLGEEFRGWVS